MITHVALKSTADGRIWSLPKPNRHDEIFKTIDLDENVVCLCGFLNENGVFLTRNEAWFEAHKCGQLLPPYDPVNPSIRFGKPNEEPGPLFSEDIW